MNNSYLEETEMLNFSDETYTTIDTEKRFDAVLLKTCTKVK